MTAEQAWNVLRSAAEVEIGDRHYFSAPSLHRRAYVRSKSVAGLLTVGRAATTLGVGW